MKAAQIAIDRPPYWPMLCWLTLLAVAWSFCLMPQPAPGQTITQRAVAQRDDAQPAATQAAERRMAQPDKMAAAESKAEAALAEEEPEEAEAAAAPEEVQRINILTLLVRGGYLMLPIAAMSLLVVTFGVERFLGLRRSKVIPPEFIDGLSKLGGRQGGFEPRAAYKLCQQYPSTAAYVVRTMLLKVGRPHTELEHAVSEASEREAARLYSNVRWLGLAAGVSPLLGLLGTVWGMIMAFFHTANLPTGANKAEFLANGIYVALVTTFAGLAVAIPAAVLAHWFEGRIQSLFRELDEILLGLMPQLERFEGRLRMSPDQLDPSERKPDGKPHSHPTKTGEPPKHEAAANPK